MANIKDIAEKAGVSVTTVSRVITIIHTSVKTNEKECLRQWNHWSTREIFTLYICRKDFQT